MMLKKNQITKTAALFLLSCAASSFAAEEYFFSLLDSKGKVLMDETKMLAGKTYYCGGINLTDPKNISISQGAICDLDDGNYTLVSRATNGGEETTKKFNFTIATTKYYFSLLDSKGNVVLAEEKMPAGEVYYCGIDLTDPLNVTLNQGAMCDLAEGKYTLQSRTKTGDKENTGKTEFEVVKVTYNFSLLDSKGKTLLAEDKMVAGKTYYCGGIDLTNALHPVIDLNKMCDLDEGEYTLKSRTKMGEKESVKNTTFNVTTAKFFFSLLDSKEKVVKSEKELLAGGTYNCGGIDLTDPLEPKINGNLMCDLDEGKYILQSRVTVGEQSNVQKYEFAVSAPVSEKVEYFYSLLNSEGDVVLGEDKMLAGKVYYCGIDLTNSEKAVVSSGAMCDLAEGHYTLVTRAKMGSQEKTQYYDISIVATKYFYSLLDSKGKVLMGEDKMLAGKTYYCGGIDLTNVQQPKVDYGKLCELGDGDYTLQARVTSAGGEKKQEYKITVTSPKYYFSLLDSKGKTVVGEDELLAGKSYNCGGIDLTDSLKPKVDLNKMCELAAGDYVLQRRISNGDKDDVQKTEFSVASAAKSGNFYSLLDSKGKVVMGEDEMLAGKSYYCGGIDLTDALKPNLDLGKMCDLDDGDYYLQIRTVNGNETNTQKVDFTIASTKYYFTLKDSKGNVVAGEDKLLAGKTYYCGGINLTNPKSISFNKSKMCDLKEGDYVLLSRTSTNGKDNVQEFKFSVAAAASSSDVEYYYSLLDSKGKTVMGEDKMVVGKTYYCGGIDLTDPLEPKVNPNKMCELADGDYTLKFRSKSGDTENKQEFKITVTSTKYYFSLLNSKGKTVMGEDELLVGDKYYCGGIDLTDPLKPVVNSAAVCELAEGKYVLKERVVNGSKESKDSLEFSVTSTKYYFSLLDSKGKTVMGEDKMLAGGTYYCGGIDLTDPLNIKVNPNVICDLDNGDYTLRSRVKNGDQEKKQDYKFTLSLVKVYYSVENSKGKTILGEDEMLPGGIYFCAIDLTAIPDISIGAEFCNIDKGKYVFKRREVNGKDEKIDKYDFEVVVTSLPGFGGRVSVAKLSVSGRIMQMSLENARADYSVMDLQGRVIAKGVLQSRATVAVPMAGTYLVKIGSEVRKVNVR